MLETPPLKLSFSLSCGTKPFWLSQTSTVCVCKLHDNSHGAGRVHQELQGWRVETLLSHVEQSLSKTPNPVTAPRAALSAAHYCVGWAIHRDVRAAESTFWKILRGK